jgi:hypothetical protein
MSTDRLTEWENEAREMGRQAGIAAASWIVDGRQSSGWVKRMVKMLDDGDPEFYDWIEPPNLSGEWANHPTPTSLYVDITGRDPLDSLNFENEHSYLMDRIADAWEQGVSETFDVECERILRAALS